MSPLRRRRERADGVGLDHDPRRIAEAGFQEFLAAELREGDVGGDFVAIRAEEAVDHEHRGNGERSGQRAAVAAVDDAAERRAAEAVLADAAVPVEVGVDADEAVVVEGLHDRHPLPRGRPVDGRRDERKRVVAVDHVGSVLADERGDLAVGR